MVVRKKLDNLSLGENFLYAKEDELNSLKIIFLKMNFENEFWIIWFLFVWDFGLLQYDAQVMLELLQ